MEKFKIRCSAIGQIMTKSGKFTKGVEAYCDNWILERIYNRKKEFANKYTEKGNIVEDESLDFVSIQLGYGFLFKNQQYFEDDYMTGTPDIITKDHTLDVKNSWDCFTFPLLANELPEDNYDWQGQGYMNLAGKDLHKVVYVLSDTPKHLIEKEAFFYCRNNGYEDHDDDIYNMFENKLTYPNIDPKLRIRVFEVPRDDRAIQSVRDRVDECREYIDKQLQKIRYGNNVLHKYS